MPLNNPKGKGGFGDRPQDINRTGANKGSSLNLTKLLKEKLEEIPKEGKEAYKDLFINTLLHKGLVEKDLQSLKLIMNYVDGLPRQTIGLDGGEEDKPISIIQLKDGAIHTNNSNE